MQILTDAQYKIEAEPILRKVFVNDYPFDNTFSFNITERLIVFPCGNYIEPTLIEGLIAAASELGEQNCYLTNLFLYEDTTNHYYLSLPELYEEYVNLSCKILPEERLDLDCWIEYVIYSEQGTWGLMVSHEHHGMLGGSSQFINKIREFVPDLDEQVNLFLKKLKSISYSPGARLEWLPGLLTHVYGQQKAEILIQKTSLSEFFNF